MLSEEDKKKIEEEEYRKKVKASLKEEAPPPKKKSIGCLGIVGILFVVGIFTSAMISAVSPNKSGSTNTSTSTPKPKEDLNGTVNFDGSQFIIVNKESRDWESCRLRVNDKYQFPTEEGLLGAETKVIGKIEAGSTYKIGAGNLTLKDGTRYNPYQVKPTNFVVACDNGFGYWSW